MQRQHADGEPRFFMLATIREYGLEQLAAAGEETETRRRHADWYLELTEELWPAAQRRFDTAHAVSVLDTEHDNLRAALTWLNSASDDATVLQLAGAVFLFWYVHGALPDH